MEELIRIGYWRSREAPQWPDPAWFVDEGWEPMVRAKVIGYLQTAPAFAYAGGFSWCRFRCGDTRLGCAEQTDGIYLWPSGLAHYLEWHAVRLPDEFVEHALKYTPQPLPKINRLPRERDEWWLTQKGWQEGETWDTDGTGGRLLLRPYTGTLSIAILRFLRQFPSYALESTEKVVSALRSGQALVLSESWTYWGYLSLSEPARVVGLEVEYQEPDRPYGTRRFQMIGTVPPAKEE